MKWAVHAHKGEMDIAEKRTASKKNLVLAESPRGARCFRALRSQESGIRRQFIVDGDSNRLPFVSFHPSKRSHICVCKHLCFSSHENISKTTR